MSSAITVHAKRFGRKDHRILPWRKANVRIIYGDTLTAFTQGLRRCKPDRITIVSPWVSSSPDGALFEVIRYAREEDSQVTFITRPPQGASDNRGIEGIRRLSSSIVILNSRLHAKIYICRKAGGDGFAVTGSANITDNSSRLIEVGVFLAPPRGSHLLSDLADRTLIELRGLPDSVVLKPYPSKNSRRN